MLLWYSYGMPELEQIVFVDKDGRPTGVVGPKLESHTNDTKLHLGFSCYILRHSDNKFLMTQRALSKKVWSGVWTNSVCGHPMPGESMETAVRRRTKFELGIENLHGITCVLSNYTYTTPLYQGIIENEFCPVFVAYTADSVHPNPEEVAAYYWLSWSEYVRKLKDNTQNVSYWAKDQCKYLENREPFVSLTKQ